MAAGKKDAVDSLVRAESLLVRWEDGLALFRVRLTRADGAVAEAHAAAHDGEAEQFWIVAEDRAHARARTLLDSLPFSASGAAADVAVTAPVAAEAVGGPPAASKAPAYQAETPKEGFPAEHAAIDPLATPDSFADPFEEELPASNGTGPHGPGTARPAAAAPRPGHIRGEPGGVSPPPASPPTADTPPTPASPPASAAPASAAPASAAPAGGAPATPRVSPPRTTPAPLPARCTHPGCNLPLTPAQATLSTHKYGQLLCSQHQRDHDVAPPKG